MEKKRKKKGRPSLLDLQRRSLRLQKQLLQQEHQENKGNANPSPSPYLRFHSSNPSHGTSDGSPFHGVDGGRGEEDEESSGQGREKKLKLVLRLHENDDGDSRAGDSRAKNSHSDGSASESNVEGEASRKKRKIDAVRGDESLREKTGRQNPSSKATDRLHEGASDSGPTTPLPDEMLLVFVLDRLQKKDTYGVFSEPVDPSELPDYHEIIAHPMDFSTVRKRLSDGYYANLEMFEADVFLICSNAMRYNAPDTIYFRQARSIQELARKDFENLRQESSDDSEPETKSTKRGRPPSKNGTKKAGGRPAERSFYDLSRGVTLTDGGDSSHDLAKNGHGLKGGDWMTERLDRNGDSGSVKGALMRPGKKVPVLDENRRHTYEPPQLYPSVLATFDGEKRQLVPVEIRIEHAYARSLARFAANLGPAGWEIAARQIAKVLPLGTKFGRGWVGEQDAPQRHQQPHAAPWPEPPTDAAECSPPASVSPAGTRPRQPPFHGMNGLINNAALGFSLLQAGKTTRPAGPTAGAPAVSPPGAVHPALAAGARGEPERARLDWSSPSNAVGLSTTSQRASSLLQKPGSAPPDLNVRFQSAGWPPAAALDGQPPDLALQL
ncbi:unnamed protein product [Spirodela intermedia]|uniref:Bromo domain-containing protein n=1 Tax=Spirodela intermedia TaxID=51605 RepID=A0A7I8LKU1_SPIIN|nr:unnamed protein product [Spirodela intermedia]